MGSPRLMRAVILWLLLMTGAGVVAAEQLKLTGNRHFVVVASSRNIDVAIGIARLYDQADPMGVLPAERAAFAAIVARRAVAAAGPGGEAGVVAAADQTGMSITPRVVTTDNAMYATVLGPVDDPSMDAVRAGYRGAVPLPADAFLDNGAHFTATVWLPTHPALDAALLGKDRAAELSSGSFKMSVALEEPAAAPQGTAQPASSERIVHLSGGDADGLRFDQRYTIERPFSDDGSLARLVWLDHAARYPQLVLQQRAGVGTSKTWVFNRSASGSWKAWNAGLQDEIGFHFDDPDQAGNTRLVGQDLAFIGAIKIGRSFSRNPVAPADLADVKSSVFERIVKEFHTADFQDVFGLPKPAPPYVLRIAGEDFWKESDGLASQSVIAQTIAGFEFRARLASGLWRSNEFLAGWLTTSALVSAGESRWPLLLQLYNRSEDRPAGQSPFGMAETFPQRLVALWRRLDYQTVLSSMALPIRNLESHQTVAANGPADLAGGESQKAPDPVFRGSGLIVADGFLVTYGHLLKGCGKIYVGVRRVDHPARRVAEAVVKARQDDSDDSPGLVLLQASLKTQQTLLFAEDQPALGASVTGFGYPDEEPLSATGNFAQSHIVRTMHDDDDRYMQFTAPFWQGSAGGPLLDEHGALVGLINGGDFPKLPGGMFERVGFALQSDLVAEFLSDNGIKLFAPTSDEKRSPVEIATTAADLTARVYCDK